MALLLDILSWPLIVAGAAIILIGSLGLVRLPDAYTRMHAAGMTDTLGAALLVLGMLLQAPDWLVAVKLVMIALFLGIASPTTSHALARAAIASGLKPWTRSTAETRAEETVP